MANKKPSTATPKPAEADAAPAAPAPEKLVAVVAAKAFLGSDGWVQPGQEIEVTATRKRELARNGLLQGEDASNDNARSLDEARDTTRKLHISGSAGDQTEETT